VALLQRWDCTIDYAAGARGTLERAGARPVPDAVLLDVHLDGVEGPALYARLCERWGSAPPVILLTAERDPSLRAIALERGWGFLEKPVRPPALRALLTQLRVRSAA
jgi:histidine kinase